MSFEDKFEQDKKDNGIKDSAGFLKLVEGDNKMRVLTEPEIVVSRYGKGICYKGCGYCDKASLGKDDARLTYKYMAWVHHLKTDKLYLYSIPYSVVADLIALKQDSDYAFDTFPMPYDINIKADENVGTKKVKYSLIAARKNTEIAPEVLEALEAETPVEKVIQSMKDKKIKEDENEGKMDEFNRNSVDYPSAESEGIDPEKQAF